MRTMTVTSPVFRENSDLVSGHSISYSCTRPEAVSTPTSAALLATAAHLTHRIPVRNHRRLTCVSLLFTNPSL